MCVIACLFIVTLMSLKLLRLLLLVANLAMLLSACRVSRPVMRDAQQRNQIASYALSQIGAPYRYGGTNRKGYDCSGLVHQSYAVAGIALPRVSAMQFKVGKKIGLSSSRPGDLIFFKQKGKINHVAIITKRKGNSVEIVHSTTSRGVIKEGLAGSKYWQKRLVAVKNVIDP